MAASPPDDFVRKPEVNIVFYGIARFLLRLAGWKIIGQLPGHPKFIIAAYPHTTNWDGILMILTSWFLRARFSWMGKAEIMRPPLGWLPKALGGIPIDRSARFNAVEQMIQYIEKQESVVLVVAPEGTRRKTEYLKTGFYWIADGAKIPILCVSINYPKKFISLEGPLIHTTGDMATDMEAAWPFCRLALGRHPENMGKLQMRPPETDE